MIIKMFRKLRYGIAVPLVLIAFGCMLAAKLMFPEIVNSNTETTAENE